MPHDLYKYNNHITFHMSTKHVNINRVMRHRLYSLVLDGRLPPAGRKGNISRMILNIGIFSLKDPHEGLFKSNVLCKKMLTEQMSKSVSMHSTLYHKFYKHEMS